MVWLCPRDTKCLSLDAFIDLTISLDKKAAVGLPIDVAQLLTVVKRHRSSSATSSVLGLVFSLFGTASQINSTSVTSILIPLQLCPQTGGRVSCSLGRKVFFPPDLQPRKLFFKAYFSGIDPMTIQCQFLPSGYICLDSGFSV